MPPPRSPSSSDISSCVAPRGTLLDRASARHSARTRAHASGIIDGPPSSIDGRCGSHRGGKPRAGTWGSWGGEARPPGTLRNFWGGGCATPRALRNTWGGGAGPAVGPARARLRLSVPFSCSLPGKYTSHSRNRLPALPYVRSRRLAQPACLTLRPSRALAELLPACLVHVGNRRAGAAPPRARA